jgi:hypothetical protein
MKWLVRDVHVRYIILFSSVFVATTIAFAFVGQSLFEPAESDTAAQAANAPPLERTLAPPVDAEPAGVDPGPSVVRFVSTTDDSVADDQDGEPATSDEDESATASPSDLPVETAADEVDHAASVSQKPVAPTCRSQTQRRRNCRPLRWRFHRCRRRR